MTGKLTWIVWKDVVTSGLIIVGLPLFTVIVLCVFFAHSGMRILKAKERVEDTEYLKVKPNGYSVSTETGLRLRQNRLDDAGHERTCDMIRFADSSRKCRRAKENVDQRLIGLVGHKRM